MNFDTKHSVENNVFGVEIKFAGYGTDDMPEKQEQALFNDLGNPEINLGSIVFEGYFKVDGDKRVVPATVTPAKESTPESSDGDKVSFIVNAKRFVLDENFVASYYADAADVAASELGTQLTTARLVAEAKALLFQEKVHEAIKKAVSGIKAERTRFEGETVPTLTV